MKKFIDLGLPSGRLWADRNIGANAPHEYGNYNYWEEWLKKRITNWCSRPALIELLEEATWQWTTQNEVNGHLVTGPNGNSIFIPAGGYKYQNKLYKINESTELWIAFRDGGNQCMSLWSDDDHDPHTNYTSGYYELPIREVIYPEE